jgi:hypothetical protein
MRRAAGLDASPTGKPMRQDVPEGVDDGVLGLSRHLYEALGYRGLGKCNPECFACDGEGDFLGLVEMQEILRVNSMSEEVETENKALEHRKTAHKEHVDAAFQLII